MAFVLGVLLYALLHGQLAHQLEKAKFSNMVNVGLAGFLYLEVLDASFSFDGVIGAFAITGNIFIILIGLGIGAFFVRSLTIYFVQSKTLTKVRYLEHGAHYAIGFLALVMFLKIFIHVPEVISGTLGMLLIVASVISSLRANRKD